MRLLGVFLIPLLAHALACGDDGGSGEPALTAYFDLSGNYASEVNGTSRPPIHFWDAPWPSDLRLDANGVPDVSVFPNGLDLPLIHRLQFDVATRKGWNVMPLVYFRFTGAVPPRALADVIPATGDQPVMLVDIDPASPEKGARYPVVAHDLTTDAYAVDYTVAIAARPGAVLRANTKYAVVIRKAFAPDFTRPTEIADLAAGKQPKGALGAAAKDLFAPLWDELDALSIARDDVLVATVFTTGDEVAHVRARSEGIRAANHVTIDHLALDGADTYDGFCVLEGTIDMPQFQRGMQPFDTLGDFALDANDIPMKQSSMTIPVVITLPKTQMPVTGWPLYQFFHGSGGLSTGIVDLGHSPDAGDHPDPGKGPGYVVAHHGIAAVSSALPVNPERLEGATDYAYLNLNNISAFPFTFQQGIYEQRLLTDALEGLQIDQSVLAACGNIAPADGAKHFFDKTKRAAGGQSMGGMYTNLVGAVEPRFGALVPTGAGGYWNLMILETAILPGALDLLAAAVNVETPNLSFAHPVMSLLSLGWESAEPVAYMARVARRPLADVPAKHVYEPVGKDDTYFPIDVYDAAALSYGNQEAVNPVWPSMADALATDDITQLATYPVSGNRDGKTRVVVQFVGDGLIDAHYIYRQLDSVKHQYGCYLESFFRDGVPTVPSPDGALFDACPPPPPH